MGGDWVRGWHLAASASSPPGWGVGASPPRPALGTHMLRFCLAFSMSLLISGVMLNRSFLGMGRGIMGDRTSSGFFLHGTRRSQAPGVAVLGP